MRRSLMMTAAAVAAMSFSLPVLAQEKQQNCPPGSWFCEDVEVQVPSNVQRPQTPPPVVVTPPQAPAQAPPPPAAPPQWGVPNIIIHNNSNASNNNSNNATNNNTNQAAPPVVVYQPPPERVPHVIIVAPGWRPPPPMRRPPPPPPRPRWHPEWGLNMRLEGIAMGGADRHGGGASPDAAMGGIGLSLRYRPVPHFAFDAGIDLVAGTDYNGFQRTETPFSLSGLLYVNPRSRAQFYFIGGVDFSHAEVKSDSRSPLLQSDGMGGYGASYDYFGGHGGIGMEFRVSRRVGLNIDGMGFMRKRTDDQTATPEFYDPNTGRTTNTSGGGIFRGGLTFWW